MNNDQLSAQTLSSLTAIIPGQSDIAADLVISAGKEILKELSTMKNLFSILLGLALFVGCQPAGGNGGDSDDPNANTTGAVEIDFEGKVDTA